MARHAIPQDIMSFEFKLFGELTIRQFVYVGVGGAIAYMCLASNMSMPLKIFLAVFFGGGGAALALVPIDKRSLDVWLGNYISAMLTPTKRAWRRKDQKAINTRIAYDSGLNFQTQSQEFTQGAPQNNSQTPSQSIPSLPPIPTALKSQNSNNLVDFKSTLNAVQSGPQSGNPLTDSGSVQPVQNLPAGPNVSMDTPSSANTSNLLPTDIPAEDNRVQSETSLNTEIGDNSQKDLQENTAPSLGIIPKVIKKPTDQQNLQQKISTPDANTENNPAPIDTSQVIGNKPNLQEVITNSLVTAVGPGGREIIELDMERLFEHEASLLARSIAPNTLKGLVKDSSGSLVEGAVVIIKNESLQPVRATTTNALGEFESSIPLPNGKYTIDITNKDKKMPLYRIKLVGKPVSPMQFQFK